MELFASKKFEISHDDVSVKLKEFVAVHKIVLDYFEGIQSSLTFLSNQGDREKELVWLEAIEPQILTLYKLKFFVERVLHDASADVFMRERGEFARSKMGLEEINEVMGLFTAYSTKKGIAEVRADKNEVAVAERDIDAEVIRFLNRISLQTNLDLSVLKNYVQFERVAGLRPEFVDFFFVVEEFVDLLSKLVIEEVIKVEENHRILTSSSKLLIDTHLLNSIGAIQYYYGKLKDFDTEQQLLREQEKEKNEVDLLIQEMQSFGPIDFSRLIQSFLHGAPNHSATLSRRKIRESVTLFFRLFTQLLDKKVLSPVKIQDVAVFSQFYVLDKTKVVMDLASIKTEKQLQQQYSLLQVLEHQFEGVDVEDWKKEVAVEFAKSEVLIGQLAFHGLECGARFLTQLTEKVLESSSPSYVTELAQFLTYYELIISILCDEIFEGNLVYEVEDRTHYLQFSSLEFVEKVVFIHEDELVDLEKLAALCQRLKVFYQQVQRINLDLAQKSYALAKQIFAHIAQENELSVSGFKFTVYNPNMDKVFGTLYQFIEREIAKIENYFLGKDIIFHENLVSTLDLVKLYNSLVFKGLHDDFRTRDPEYPPQRKLFSGSQLSSFDAVSDTLGLLRSVLISMEKEAQREEEMEDTYPIVERIVTMNNQIFRKLPYLKEHLLSNNQQFFQKSDQKYLLSPNTTEVQLKELCFEKGFSFVEFHNFLLNLDRFIALHTELSAFLYTYRPLRNGTNSLANYYIFTPIVPENNSLFSVLKKVFIGSNLTNSSLFSEKYERFKRQKFSSKEFRDSTYLDNVNETLEEWKSVLLEHRLLERVETYDDDFMD